jgi:hypothetical protein
MSKRATCKKPREEGQSTLRFFHTNQNTFYSTEVRFHSDCNIGSAGCFSRSGRRGGLLHLCCWIRHWLFRANGKVVSQEISVFWFSVFIGARLGSSVDYLLLLVGSLSCPLLSFLLPPLVPFDYSPTLFLSSKSCRPTSSVENEARPIATSSLWFKSAKE